MPAFSTHHLFAEEMMETIKKSVRGVKLDERAVIYGTQGPDFLFFHRILPTMPGKSLTGVGSRIHRADPAKLFKAMADYINDGKNYDRDTVISYFCGFICHYALDRSVHPFVYWAMEDIKEKENITYHPFVLHNRIEFDMDMIFLREKRNITNALNFSTKSFLSGDEILLNEMARASCAAFSSVLEESLNKDKFYEAFSDFRYMQGVINSGKKWHISLLKAIQFPFKHFIGPGLTAMMLSEKPDEKYDYMNSAKRVWHYPDNKDITLDKSVFELFEEAKTEAEDMIKGFFDVIEGKQTSETVFGHRSFLNGEDVI